MKCRTAAARRRECRGYSRFCQQILRQLAERIDLPFSFALMPRRGTPTVETALRILQDDFEYRLAANGD